MKPTYLSPAEVADEMVEDHVHAIGCEDCEGLDVDDYCLFHEGYREGVLVLLLKASLQ